jgi:hypothetical protein
MATVDKIEMNSDQSNLKKAFRGDEELLLEGRDPDLNGTPVYEDDFVGYTDGEMILGKNSPGPTDQDYDRFASELQEELGLEFGAYLSENTDNRDDTVDMNEFEEAVSHLDPNYVVGKIEGENGDYMGVRKI